MVATCHALCFVDDGAGGDAGSSQLELGGLNWCYTGTDRERAELAATAKVAAAKRSHLPNLS